LPSWAQGGPGSPVTSRTQIIPGIPWDHELISFWLGAILLVVVPIFIIKLGFKQPLSDYGLGLPPKGRRSLGIWTFIILTVVSLPAFYLGAGGADMQKVYPIFKSFTGINSFILYELTYLPFFIAIEFIFRGYLLFGLAGVRDKEVKKIGGGYPGVFFFGRYALLIQMLSYTAWHLGKPTPELWGTLVWGLLAGTLAYYSRSIWPVVASHWLLNVFLDLFIWQKWV
jgi:CAAX protease family protein